MSQQTRIVNRVTLPFECLTCGATFRGIEKETHDCPLCNSEKIRVKKQYTII